MKNSESLALVLIAVGIFVISKFSDLRAENTRLQINKIKNDLYMAEDVFERMLIETKDQEINWSQSGIGTQKRVVERMKSEIVELESKRRRFVIFYF